MRILCFVCFFMMVGCTQYKFLETRIPFTHDIRQANNLTEEHLKSYQFYNSGPIVLFRQVTGEELQNMKDQVVERDGKYYEEVLIDMHTPCVLESTEENVLSVSFEKGTTLRFGSMESHRKSWEGKYVLLAESWSEGVGKVPFAGKEYSAKKGSGQSYLLIDKDALLGNSDKIRKLPGRLVQD